jgi:hypothetical protein
MLDPLVSDFLFGQVLEFLNPGTLLVPVSWHFFGKDFGRWRSGVGHVELLVEELGQKKTVCAR